MSSHNIQEYLQEIQKILSTGDAREHAYRPAFQKLIEDISSDIQAINEPAYTGGNAPDFLFKKGDTPIAYAECKDVTVDISNKEVQKQAHRYTDAFGKILLTNYYDFQIIQEDGNVVSISIATKNGNEIVSIENNFNQFINLIKEYITPDSRTIKSAKKLAKIMASKARIVRDNALASLGENKESDIFAQYESFKQVLIHDMSEEEFADMYAQTIVYGLFVARYYDPTLKNFSRHEAQDLLPSTNPLLKKFFGHVAGTDYDPKIAWLVDSLIETYLSTNVASIMNKEFKKKQKDPVLHFYETFLSDYDKSLRKSRGVYYTPEPVVSFIVRSVDEILKTKFNLVKGLTDTSMIDFTEKVQATDGRTKDGIKQINKKIHKVQILDPALGTGTFLNEVIHEMHKTFVGQEGQWSDYAENHIIPRLHGFELMMASYTMAHLKLGITLKELGYIGEDRLSVWLTNSLEESVHEVPNLFMSKWLTEESNQASKIKSEMPIMVVLGNPPYSGESFNKNYHGHDVYKVEPGGEQKLQERNSKWLNDDYVKFIRFAENQIEKTGEGVVSFITAHGYLDNPTFRGMRWHLMKTFDEIYILDLHGNSLKKEITPDGEKDENVFNIQQGTAIIFGIKKKENDNKLAQVFHSDIYGKKNDKYKILDNNAWDSINWVKLQIQSKGDLNFFIPKDFKMKKTYSKGFGLKEVFNLSGVGICSKRDKIAFHDQKKDLLDVLSDFEKLEENEIKTKYKILKESRDQKVSYAKQNINEFGIKDEYITKISYRPFDSKWTYFTDKTRGFLAYPVYNLMKHFIMGENIGLITNRQCQTLNYHHSFITKTINDLHITETANANPYTFPLYLYADDGTKVPNLDKEIWQKINEVVGDTKPEDILYYIYAMLHSPSYRKKYKEFLKIDFPRVPYPENKEIFFKLVDFGRELRGLHLLESEKVHKFITIFPEGGSNIVEEKYPKYEDEKVFINEKQYFGNVSEIAWNFYIGGYQPAQKWLKDRRERKLSNEDLDHYQEMIVSLAETDRIMEKINEVLNV